MLGLSLSFIPLLAIIEVYEAYYFSQYHYSLDFSFHGAHQVTFLFRISSFQLFPFEIDFEVLKIFVRFFFQIKVPMRF